VCIVLREPLAHTVTQTRSHEREQATKKRKKGGHTTVFCLLQCKQNFQLQKSSRKRYPPHEFCFYVFFFLLQKKKSIKRVSRLLLSCVCVCKIGEGKKDPNGHLRHCFEVPSSFFFSLSMSKHNTWFLTSEGYTGTLFFFLIITTCCSCGNVVFLFPRFQREGLAVVFSFLHAKIFRSFYPNPPPKKKKTQNSNNNNAVSSPYPTSR
jgi:hypothetical protein